MKQQDKEIEYRKKSYASFMKKYVFTNPRFVRETASVKPGTHLIRKFATTFLYRANGGSMDDTDYRARWKAQRQYDWYTNTQLNWPDINTASHLCKDSICLYKPHVDAGVADKWLANSVARRIISVLGDNVGAILAKPLLWACFEELTRDFVLCKYLQCPV